MACSANKSNATAGIGSAILSANNGTAGPLLYDTVSSIFGQEGGWRTVKDYHVERLDVTPINTPAFGGIANFNMPKISDYVGRIQLLFTISFDVAGGAALPVKQGVVGGAGYAAIREVTLTYTSGNIQRITGDDLFLHDYLRTTSNDRNHLDNLTDLSNGVTSSAGTPLSVGLEGTGAIVGFEVSYVMNLPVWWSWSPKTYIPYLTLANDIKIDVEFQQTSKFLYSFGNGGASANTVSNVQLKDVKFRYESILVPQSQRAVLHDMVNSSQDGLLYKILDHERHAKEIIPAGSTKYILKLANLRSPTITIVFYCRLKAEVDEAAGDGSPGAQGPVYHNYQCVDKFHLRGNNGVIFPEVDSNYALHHINATHWHNDLQGKAIYSIPFTVTPMDYLNSTGGLDMGNLNNPSLVLEWAAPTAADMYLDVNAFTHNFVQIKGGDMIKLLH